MEGYRAQRPTDPNSEPEAVKNGKEVLAQVTRMNNTGGSSDGVERKVDDAIHALKQCEGSEIPELIQALEYERGRIVN